MDKEVSLMWTCSLLKTNAKNVLSRSYWRVFAVCAVALLLTGGLNIQYNSGSGQAESLPEQVGQVAGNSVLLGFALNILLSLGILVGLLILLATTVGWSIFFGPVVEVGWCRYMIRNRSETPEFTTLFSAFGPGYWNVVAARFYANLRIFLFTLLLVVPGVIKGYEYRLVPYLLAENPGMAPARAAELSSLITTGEKWNMFILDLSFIGWRILGALLFGLGNLFVEPYYQATFAELYAALRAKAIAQGYTNEAELRGSIGPFDHDF